jgi:hypothetical protein
MWFLLCCGPLRAAAADDGQPLSPPRQHAGGMRSDEDDSSGRRALQNAAGGYGYGGSARSEPCSGAGAQLAATSGSLDFFDGHADGDVCSWTITCPPSGGTPVLVFTEFDTERGYDFVDVFSGADASGGLSSRLAHLSGPSLSQLSGSGLSGSYTASSQSNKLHLLLLLNYF